MLPNEIEKVFNVLKSAGHKSFLFGGTVRDLLLARAPNNWNILTSAPNEKIQELFSESITRLRNGEVNIVVSTLPMIDITSFHNYNSIDAFLKGCDFSLNSLIMDSDKYLLYSDNIIAGLKDIFNKKISFYKNESFIYSPISMLRAIRLSAELGFKLTEKVEEGLHGSSFFIGKASMVDKRIEFLKLLQFEAGPNLLIKYRIMDYFFNDFSKLFSISNGPTHSESAGTHLLLCHREMLKLTNDKRLLLIALTHDIGKLYNNTPQHHSAKSYDIVNTFLNELQFSQSFKSYVLMFIHLHMNKYPSTEQEYLNIIDKFKLYGITVQEFALFQYCNFITNLNNTKCTLIDFLNKNIYLAYAATRQKTTQETIIQ